MNYPLITLYVPGTRPELIEKAGRVSPDAVIIDLEDTVPTDRKNQVRQDIADILPSVALPALIRVNNEPDFLEADLRAMTNQHVYALFLPKAEDPAQIQEVDAIMAEAERAGGLEVGSVKLIPMMETALGVVRCFELATAAARVESVSFGSAEDGDLQGDLQCAWSLEGTELMYARSKVLLDARAARLPYVLDGAFSDIKNDDALRIDCQLSKRLGYDGRTAVHPQQVAVAREAYAANADELDYYHRLITAFE
ncbi:MAG: CoA ester lyase, partial [Alphaproteobacteria bacterium]|nr:CoA ester lyase [Alphaproteobacteria bacterium]